MIEERIYNPLDKDHLAESIVREFFKRPLHPLPPEASFTGAGIYALYYRGTYPLYSQIAASLHQFEADASNVILREKAIPIYIGKSDPPGSRKGLLGDEGEDDEKEAREILAAKPIHRKLYERLGKHATSIRLVKNLQLGDFQCRYMLVDEVWVALGEASLVNRFRPIWNVWIEGFGSNVEGGGRAKTARPIWDIIHPGRKDALDLQIAADKEAEIVARLQASATLMDLQNAVSEHRKAKLLFARERKKPNEK